MKLIIVESPGKIKKISSYLNKEYTVISSKGHIRDLPKNKLGVDLDNFSVDYEIIKGKNKDIIELKKAIKKSNEIYLATDGDREGEAIAWHIIDTIKPKINYQRILFYEITKKAVQDSLKHTQSINNNLVKAQETRRIIDRLYGYMISPILWRKLMPKLSAGRVQSSALRLIVEREEERIKFNPTAYSSIELKSQNITAHSSKVDDIKIADGQDIINKKDNKKYIILNKEDADSIINHASTAQIIDIQERKWSKSSKPPFTTSTLCQAAFNKFGYSTIQTMKLAQTLYENGYITYMRTDSVKLSEEGIRSAQNTILNKYSNEYIKSSPAEGKASKFAQEAHEAIRPTEDPFVSVDDIPLDENHKKLYELILIRTLQANMSDAKGITTIYTILLKLKDHPKYKNITFTASQQRTLFPGFLILTLDNKEKNSNNELRIGEINDIIDDYTLSSSAHVTTAKARYNEGSLISKLSELGIGRPSTYSPIIAGITKKGYIYRYKNTLVPTFTAFAIVNFLKTYFAKLIDYQFTADIENILDQIAENKLEYKESLNQFYKDTDNGLLHIIEDIQNKELDLIKMKSINVKDNITIRVGRYGNYINVDDKTVTIPNNIPPDEINQKIIDDIIAIKKSKDINISDNIVLKNGVYGYYLLCNKDDKIVTKAIPAFLDKDSINEEMANILLSMPKYIGKRDEKDIYITNTKLYLYIMINEKKYKLPDYDIKRYYNMSERETNELIDELFFNK